RKFLKITGLAGLGVAGGGLLQSFAAEVEPVKHHSRAGSIQSFNMCGYAAPKLETVRVGFIGLGSRGPGHVMNLTKLEGVQIVGLSDLLEEEVQKVNERIAGLGHQPTLYSGSQDEWKKLCDRN